MTATVEAFRSLHQPGAPLVLYNVWDAGSAKVVAAAGAPAIATGSYAVAGAFGAGDGEKLPLAEVLANVQRIVAAVDVPVTIDLEAGYGADPAGVRNSAEAVRAAGAVGINLEDRLAGEARPLAVAPAAERIAAAASSGLFVNARCDLFWRTSPDEALIAEAIARAHSYANAGASGFFVPFLNDAEAVRRICAGSPLPVNVNPQKELGALTDIAALGVARISYGHLPWAKAMKRLGEEAAAIYG